MKRIIAVATADTKGEELAFLAKALGYAGAPVLTVDVGTRKPDFVADVAARHVAAFHPEGEGEALGTDDRGKAVAAMGIAFARFLASRDDIAGVVGIGGGGGTSIITAGMRELPVGLPKLMVSTLASGDVTPYVGVSDIVMMPAVTDMTGLNKLSRVILHNAAQAIAAMAMHPAPATQDLPSIGLTMFGVTTACVSRIVSLMKDRFDCMPFHATGTGGRMMEKLVDSHMIEGVIDITTTEVCDLLFGGVLPATQDRFGAIERTRVPWVGSAGALDMVNFWAPSTVSERYRGRQFCEHNPNVTLMRTTPAENAAIGSWIAEKLNRCEGQIRFLIPDKGVSALDIEGGTFFDPQADAALFAALEGTLLQTERRRIIRLPLHINDPQFAEAAVAAFNEISGA